jgi:signal transduction histidine kinase
LSNALKYTPDGKTVFLTVGVETDTLHISVADEGIGIPQADLPRLFDSFQRASNVGSIAGTGLGLSIVRDSVNWHKGVIEVSSQVNQGSCFSVVLPTKILPTFQQGTPS